MKPLIIEVKSRICVPCGVYITGYDETGVLHEGFEREFIVCEMNEEKAKQAEEDYKNGKYISITELRKQLNDKNK